MTGPVDTAAANLRKYLDTRQRFGHANAFFDERDLRAVLDEREQLAARVAELEAERDRVLIEDDGRCDDCNCCSHDGCHRFASTTCPTDSLGDSVCPCTED